MNPIQTAAANINPKYEPHLKCSCKINPKYEPHLKCSCQQDDASLTTACSRNLLCPSLTREGKLGRWEVAERLTTRHADNPMRDGLWLTHTPTHTFHSPFIM